MSPVPHTTATILWTSLSEGYYSLLVWFVFPLASFMSWWVDEKTKRSMGLLFLLIIQARVTAVSVIESVMIIWFHQAGRIKKTHLFQWVKMVSQWSSAVSASLWGFLQSMPGASQGFPHWTQRGCGGAKHGLPTEATVTLERVVGPNGQPKGHIETGFTITIHFDFYIQHAAIKAQCIFGSVQNVSIAQSIENFQAMKVGIKCLVRLPILSTYPLNRFLIWIIVLTILEL